jgi:hypothetical protein
MADCVRGAARKVTRRARCPDYYCYSETVFEHSERPGQHHTPTAPHNGRETGEAGTDQAPAAPARA